MIAKKGETGLQGIVLDAVGTLLEARPSVSVTYTAAARRQGISLDPNEVRRRFAVLFGADELDEQRGPLATDEPTELRRWRRIVAGVLPGLPDPEAAFAELWEHFGRPEAWALYEDVPGALDDLLRAGYRVQIASNFDARLRSVVAGLPALHALRDDLVISSLVGYRKPHPAFYQAVCTSLDLPPERVLAVGDDPENDLHGPRRAGLHAVLVDRDGRHHSLSPRVTNLAELAALLC